MLSRGLRRPGFPRGRRVCFCTPGAASDGCFARYRRVCWFRPTLASIAARGGGRRTWCARRLRRWASWPCRSHRSLGGAAVSSKLGAWPSVGGLHSRATATSQAARRGGVSSRMCFDSSGRWWNVWALLVTR